MKKQIEKKVRSAKRLNEQEALFLFEQDDLIWLGSLANQAKERTTKKCFLTSTATSTPRISA
jgi:2-iminoacetate synthase ThiH